MSGRLASLKRAVVVSQGVQSVIEALEQRQLLSAAITLVNPDLLPSSDRLIFNTIQNLDHDRITQRHTQHESVDD